MTLGGTPWDGKHGGNSSTPGKLSDYYFTTQWGPGWSIEGDWSDPREKDNGVPNGPLPRERARFKGIYRHEGGSVLSYTVGATSILEQPSVIDEWLVRSFYLTENDQNLQLLVSDPFEKEGQADREVVLISKPANVKLETLDGGRRVLSVGSGFTKGMD